MTGIVARLRTSEVATLTGLVLLSVAGCSRSDTASNADIKKPAAPTTRSADSREAGDSSAPAKVDGSRQIRNRRHNLLLRPREASSDEGTPIVLYPQQAWKCLCWRFEPGPQASYRLVNHFTSKSFQPTGGTAGATVPVTQAACAKDLPAEQRWLFIPLGDRFYKIVNVAQSKSLTATASESNGDIGVFLAPWTGAEEQQWELLALPDKLTM